MWRCKVCGARVDDDTWETCWNCSTAKDISGDKLQDAKGNFQTLRDEKQEIAKNLKCVRCGNNLNFLGTRKLHEGPSWGFWLGNLGELFVNRMSLDQFYCPKCGKIEFFLEGVNEENGK